MVRSERLRASVPFVALGAACVIAGGLLAAVTAHAPTRHATWAVAYLVLIPGTAQILLGAGQAWLAARVPPRRTRMIELIVWNLGNAAVLGGAVRTLPYVTDVGGLLILVAGAMLFAATRGAPRSWALHGYELIVLVVLVSTPIGLVLGHLRAG